MTDQASFQLRESDQLRSLLKKVADLDSHTVEVLVEFYKRLNTNRRRLLIVAPRETPAGITLRISNLGLAMPLFESIDEALANTRP